MTKGSQLPPGKPLPAAVGHGLGPVGPQPRHLLPHAMGHARLQGTETTRLPAAPKSLASLVRRLGLAKDGQANRELGDMAICHVAGSRIAASIIPVGYMARVCRETDQAGSCYMAPCHIAACNIPVCYTAMCCIALSMVRWAIRKIFSGCIRS